MKFPTARGSDAIFIGVCSIKALVHRALSDFIYSISCSKSRKVSMLKNHLMKCQAHHRFSLL